MLQNSIAFNLILDLFRPGHIRLSCIQYIVVLVYIQDWKLQSIPQKMHWLGSTSRWKSIYSKCLKWPAKYRCMPAHVYSCVCTTLHNIYIYIYVCVYFYLYHHFIHHIYRWVFSRFSKKRYPKTQERSARITRLILDKVPLADAGLEGSWEFCQIPWDDNLYISSDMGPLKLFGNMFLLYIHNYS